MKVLPMKCITVIIQNHVYTLSSDYDYYCFCYKALLYQVTNKGVFGCVCAACLRASQLLRL